ncbi:hypothetical protein [Roseovarius pelagicus]|uniref:Uncharacterized protein n=1 Tax=Roseovarius pelagicus TaxID=2980108 RepID=A0ABY6DD55_9RHOB|nr:hypothetical protein [Roseovarius pelagicus]UXX83799.1 hypothetical protein N7U68_03825 [Roseovarius pelagicus]
MSADSTSSAALMLQPPPPDPAFGPAGNGAQRAMELFTMIQDRHVAISPGLARDLAELERTLTPASDPNWGRAYGLASEAIGLRGKMGNSAPWQRLFPRFVLAVVEPIMRKGVVENRFELSLTIENPEYRAVSDFEGACRRMEEWVRLALADKTVMGQAFWACAGVSLLLAFRRQNVGRRAQTVLQLPPVPDLQLTQMVFCLEPKLEDDPLWRKKALKPSARSNRLRVGVRPREGGVTGVLHTRRLRDLPDALPSAFVVPEKIRVLKLIEEGFMIPDRPPYRRPDRNLLSLTMQAPETDGLGAAHLVKAAWIDATIRLRVLLANMSLRKSELGHAHMRDTGTCCAAVSFSGDSTKARFDPLQIKGDFRRQAVSQAVMFADVFDMLAPATKNTQSPRDRAVEVQARERLVLTCLREQAEGMRAGSMEDYASICLIEVAPAVTRGDEIVNVVWRDDRRALMRRYGFDAADTVHGARILCPPEVVSGAHFTICDDAFSEPQKIEVPEAENAEEALAKIVGAVSGWIIKQNLLAVAHG